MKPNIFRLGDFWFCGYPCSSQQYMGISASEAYKAWKQFYKAAFERRGHFS